MSSGPGWVAFVVGTPVLTFIGSFAAIGVSRLRDRELETRSKREETLRNMRWAAQLSASDRSRLATLGVAELKALLDSDVLEESEKVFVEAALGAVYEDPESELEEWGDDVDVELAPTGEASLAESEQTEIPWTGTSEGGESP